MAARTPNVLNAAIELGFVLAAGACGAAGLPLWTLPALAIAMIAYWMWNRRTGLAQLAEMGVGRLAGAAAISLALIVLALAGAYWLGSLVHGWMG